MNDLVGKQLEKYRIDALLGEGGMGTVYRARHMTLQSTAAIKVMHGHLVRQQTFKQRFLQEAQAAARLDHPGVVNVFDFGRSGEMLYMAMEFVSGGSLGHYIRKLHEQGKVVQLQEVLYILAQVADALGYAHRQGVVHRDVKPDNILLKRLEGPERPGEPPLRAVMTDFGLAKLLEGGVQTATNTFMGTLPYMSPEQTLGEELDGRSDIYSVGVILYQLATGKLPFDISTPTDAVRKHMHETPPPPRTVRPELPAKVAAIIEKALAKKPAERFQRGEVMARSLRAAAGDLTADDVTRFAPVHTVMSLMTELQAEPEKAPERPTMMVPEEAGEGAELVVARKGTSPERYPLDRPQLTIGRSPDNDVVLTEEGISRHHARLEQTADGWQIVDLGSTNGTYLGDSKLLPDLPEPWQPDQTVRIGPCFLSLRGQATPAQTHFATRLSAGATRVRSSRGGLSVAVEPTQFSAKPGGQAAMQVELFNEGMQVAHYRLEVEGLDPSWVSLSRETAQLMPGDGTTLPVTIRVPRHSSARSGAHPFRLRVISSGEQVAAVPGELTVEPFSEFSIEAQPTHVAHGKSTRLLIHNGGNTETTFAISAQDAADEARFQMAQPLVEVGPGQTETVPVGVQAAKRPFLGRKKTMPFEIAVTAPDGSAKKLPGQLEVQPVVPPWLPPILGTLLILLCLAGAGVFALINSRNAQATETAQALADSAQAATETRIAEETAAARETARAGDAQAGTATALAATAAAAGDDDGDGLSNSQEASLGTSLQNPDTDGDGLSDGQEVNQFGTSPQQQDSDGDTLLDGEEVNEYGTSPSNPDTDGDGTPDGVEVSSGTDPLQPPTATAPPTGVTPPTATSTATSTPTPTATSTPSPTPTATATSDGDGGVIIVPPAFFFDYFTHQANNENRSGQSTFIDNGLANEKPDARLIVTQFWNPDGSSGVYNDHAIGVWYNNTTNRWAIFNQDIEPMPNNAAFNVLAPAESVSFVHTATAGNITGNYTTFSHPQANNNPNAVMLITQNWNPGGGSGTYNDHNVGVWYNNSTNRWAIFNQDQNSMPANASFNVRVFDDDDPAFVHTATAGNITAGYTVIDHPSLNDNPDATVFVTQNWNPGGGGGTYNDHAIGVWYIQSSGRWSIFNQDTAGMPPGASFNVYVR